MANSLSFLMLLSLLAFAPFCLCHKKMGSYLYPQFYDYSCPQAQNIVKSILANAVAKEPRIAASLLRLHFHDCFVKVCDIIIIVMTM
jgi:peroxidase